MERKFIVAETYAAAQSKGSSKRSFNMIPTDDLDWAADQKPSVFRLFADCWRSDPYGTRWMPLTTTLKDKTLKQAKAVLRKSALFHFKSEMTILENGNCCYKTFAINLHGVCRSKWLYLKGYQQFLQSDYWKLVRTAVLKRDGYQCQQCGIKTNLHAHHLSYEHHRDEINHLEDVVTLCKNCHAQVHGR